ncbi:glycoprotein hormone beta 5 [Oratosquilla oratoria]|uniref:glycoprotein hormone beta 5 n=1 Tax=Oratosquilla oratoria TaxID=337810 RepID=UPI003F7742D2
MVELRMMTALATSGLVLVLTLVALSVPASGIDPMTTLQCHRRQYTYKVHKSDSKGRICWDHINVMSCWGRCDSNEIADWKFPYKRSHHPVCMHDDTQQTDVLLRHCEPGAEPGTEKYTFHEATQCSCTLCKSSQASCEGLRYRGARRVRASPRG